MILEPKEEQINGRTFTLSKVPALIGRKIFSQYITSATPKIGDYKLNEELAIELLSFVEVCPDSGVPIRLQTKELINNHVGDWETMMKLEVAMLNYNCSFFQDGRISTFCQDIAQRAPAWISKILTGLSEQSSPAEKPLSTN